MYEVSWLPCFRSWPIDFDLKKLQACDKKNLSDNVPYPNALWCALILTPLIDFV